MSTYTKIIVGDDGLDGGLDAAALARALAPDAEVILASAFPWDDVPSRFTQPGFGNALREDTENALDRRRAEAGLTGARTAAIADSSPARALHRLAEAERADLLVIGSAHHGPVGRLLVGDVARGVLHGAPCAVLVAPRGYAKAGAAPPTTIGVAYDGSPAAHRAVDVALALAAGAGAGAKVTIRQAVTVDIVPTFGGYPTLDLATLTEEVRDDAQLRLDALVAELAPTVPVKAEAVIGTARERLDELADEVDLLVCGSRGWGAVRRVVVGSTSDRLVHHASCPVLVVPGTAEAEEAPAHAPADAGAEHAPA